MTRSKMENRYLQDKSVNSYNDYKIQRNLCTSLLRKAKWDYFSNLNPCSHR